MSPRPGARGAARSALPAHIGTIGGWLAPSPVTMLQLYAPRGIRSPCAAPCVPTVTMPAAHHDPALPRRHPGRPLRRDLDRPRGIRDPRAPFLEEPARLPAVRRPLARPGAHPTRRPLAGAAVRQLRRADRLAA